MALRMAVLHISVSISCLSQTPIDMRMWESLGCGCQTLITWTRRIQAGESPAGARKMPWKLLNMHILRPLLLIKLHLLSIICCPFLVFVCGVWSCGSWEAGVSACQGPKLRCQFV